jgi:PII-like signaling protein
VAGFTGRGGVVTSSLVEAGGKLPLVLTFVDSEEHITRVLPVLKQMAPNHLIVSEHVELIQGLD